MRPIFTNEWGGSFILIEPGSFNMGDKNGSKFEKPVRNVEIEEPYFIGARPVTQVEWTSVMGNNPSKFSEGWSAGLRPVEMVSWLDCMSFISKLNEIDQDEKLGLVGSWRLPTESEWEFACRAGTATKWFHSDADSDLDEVGWHAGNSGATTREVGQKKANDWGLFDVHGLVGEWCSDEWEDNNLRRVHRGGSWFTESDATRSAARASANVDRRSDGIGFRLVWSPQ